MEQNIEIITERVKALRGRISTVHYRKTCEPKKSLVKKFGDIGKIEKQSVFQVRAGIDYENIKTVKEKHESGERERKGLPDTMEKIDKGIYHHKIKDTYYIGCSPIINSHSVSKSVYLLNGEETSLDTVIVEDKTLADFLYSSDLKGHDDTEWVQLNTVNIESLSGI